MKIILLKDVRGVGAHHEVREVADGYARNFLLPKRFAEPATEAKIKQLESQRQAHEAELVKQEEELGKKIAGLRGKQVKLEARATEKGGLFKSVTPKDIAKAIMTEHSLEIPESSIRVPEDHIKTTGEHPVILSNKKEKAELTVLVHPQPA